jgi:RND family efflux transporter MFP subunit
MKRIWIVLGIVAGIIIIGVAGYLGFRSSKPDVQTAPQAPETVTVSRCDVEQSVTAPGSVVNFQETAVEMPIDGRLSEVLVKPGDLVSAGDTLANLQIDPVQLAKAHVTLVEAQKKLTSAQADRDRYSHIYSNPEAIEVARANLIIANQQLTSAQSAYDSLSNLPADDPMRAMALISLNSARTAQRSAQTALNVSLGTNPSSADIDLADANLALAQANLAKAQADLDILTSGVITAPFDGVILESEAETQKFNPAGTNLFTIHNPGNIEIRVNVVEEDYPYVEVGQKVELYFDALPEVEASGMVTRILPKRVSGDRPLYYVYISMNTVPDHLVDGMTVDAAIFIAQRQQVLCLPRAVVHASSGDTAVINIWNGLTTEERQIEIGLRGDVYLEILSGLEEGEQVVTR